MRIAVNQAGKRLTYKQLDEKESDFYEVNNLDMVVSGKEKEFIQEIQQEIQEASLFFGRGYGEFGGIKRKRAK